MNIFNQYQIESFFKEYQVTVYNENNFESKSFVPIYQGPHENKSKYIQCKMEKC